MKPFKYKYEKLLNPVIVNRSGTDIRTTFRPWMPVPLLINIPCGKVEYVEIPVLKENEISTPEEVGNAVSVEMKTVKAYTFFCVAGTEFAEGGDGSESNPWASVNYALNQLQPIVDCFSQINCCDYIQLKCSGFFDYTIRAIEKRNEVWENIDFDGKNKFILNGVNLKIIKNDHTSDQYGDYKSEGIKNIKNTIFFNCKIYIDHIIECSIKNINLAFFTNNVLGISYCSGMFCSIKMEVNSKIIATADNSVSTLDARIYSYGFLHCEGTFYNCDTKISSDVSSKGTDYNQAVSGGENADYSRCDGIFYFCKGYCYSSSYGEGYFSGSNGISNGFLYCRGSFYFCSSDVASQADMNFGNCHNFPVSISYGFNGCRSKFYSCTSLVNSVSREYGGRYNKGKASSEAFGFFRCSEEFYLCSGTVKAESNGLGDCSSTAYGYGFSKCYNSLFYSCEGFAESKVPSSDEYDFKSCGFYDNGGSDFYSCSSSEKICEATSYEGECETFECDI